MQYKLSVDYNDLVYICNNDTTWQARDLELVINNKVN